MKTVDPGCDDIKIDRRGVSQWQNAVFFLRVPTMIRCTGIGEKLANIPLLPFRRGGYCLVCFARGRPVDLAGAIKHPRGLTIFSLALFALSPSLSSAVHHSTRQTVNQHYFAHLCTSCSLPP